MSKFLHTTEQFLGLIMIIAIFGLAALSVWSLSPIAKDSIKVAGLTTDTTPAHDLSNLIPVKFDLVAALPAETGIVQAAATDNREIIVRAELSNLHEGETVLGRLELSNGNLFAFPVKAQVVSFDPAANDKVVVILSTNNGKQQLNRRSAGSEAITFALPASEEPTAMILELVASESINFSSSLEIKFSY